nr:probable indole-3-pyruvate monooxygenase YUCCA11 [Ipomoea batatas]
MEQHTGVVIIGAGPAGIATSACLNLQNIPNIVLEKEANYASLWRDKSYDRLKLHLAKEFCHLPHMPFSPNAPTFLSKKQFVQYLDTYVSHFGVNPLYPRLVESASYNEGDGKWFVTVKNMESDAIETYIAKFVVAATSENGEGFIPVIDGLEGFSGEVMHSSEYRNGKTFEDKCVLVVGSGNSGMEIACDLSEYHAQSSIVVRGPVHVFSKEIIQLGMNSLKFIPVNIVDKMVVALSMWKYGDLSLYGLQRPNKGPFYTKQTTGISPIIDVGTLSRIKSGEIKVFPSIKRVENDLVEFVNGKTKRFDAIVFATGFRSTGGDGLFNENGMPKDKRPNHWKGKNGIYCVGFASSGLAGISNDANNIAEDISDILIKRKIT